MPSQVSQFYAFQVEGQIHQLNVSLRIEHESHGLACRGAPAFSAVSRACSSLLVKSTDQGCKPHASSAVPRQNNGQPCLMWRRVREKPTLWHGS